jgi:hypothetical protein
MVWGFGEISWCLTTQHRLRGKQHLQDDIGTVETGNKYASDLTIGQSTVLGDLMTSESCPRRELVRNDCQI